MNMFYRNTIKSCYKENVIKNFISKHSNLFDTLNLNYFNFFIIYICILSIFFITTTNAGELFMNSETKIAIQNITKLIELARIYPASALPDGSHQSFPIPLGGSEKQFVAFLFCPASTDYNKGLKLFHPNYIATLNVTTGNLEMLRRLKQEELIPTDSDPENVIGWYSMPEGMSSEEFSDLRNSLYNYYDVLLPVYSGVKKIDNSVLKNSASHFINVFEKVTEPALMPYYKKMGNDFLSWIKKNQDQ